MITEADDADTIIVQTAISESDRNKTAQDIDFLELVITLAPESRHRFGEVSKRK